MPNVVYNNIMRTLLFQGIVPCPFGGILKNRFLILTHSMTHEAKSWGGSSGAGKCETRTFSQRKQLKNTGIQQFLYSRAVGKDEVVRSRQPRSGLVPCGNLASSSIVEAKSALLRRFFHAKIAIRPLSCFSSPTQTHFIGLCVGISIILSRIRLFCI